MEPPKKYNTPPPIFESVLAERFHSNNSFQQLHEEEDGRVYGTMCGFKYSWKTPLDLVNFEDLPEWVKDNEFVETCHRSCLTIKQAFKSVFQIHCETGNIWTHLLATVLSIWLAVYSLPQQKDMNTLVAFSLFFFGSTAVYALSTLYHTLYVCSASMSQVLSKMDYVGIVFGIWGCQCGAILLMYPCGTMRYMFFGCVTFIGFLCICSILLHCMQGPSLRVCRALLFALFGLFGIVPIATFAVLNKHCLQGNSECTFALRRILYDLGAMGLTFLSGAAIYASCIPERWWPGRFDIVGQSHQIWHCAIVGGFMLHYLSMCKLQQSAHLFPTSGCSV